LPLHIGESEMSAREKLVMAKALAYAIKTIKNLPRRWQEYGDMQDMEFLLNKIGEPWIGLAKQAADHHIDGFHNEPPDHGDWAEANAEKGSS
jgi:hypothetical protein